MRSPLMGPPSVVLGLYFGSPRRYNLTTTALISAAVSHLSTAVQVIRWVKYKQKELPATLDLQVDRKAL